LNPTKATTSTIDNLESRGRATLTKLTSQSRDKQWQAYEYRSRLTKQALKVLRKTIGRQGNEQYRTSLNLN
jgi:hypothetical protein